MEKEEEYQKVKSFLAQLEALYLRLDEREILQVLNTSGIFIFILFCTFTH